jgi:hypothetical protein
MVRFTAAECIRIQISSGLELMISPLIKEFYHKGHDVLLLISVSMNAIMWLQEIRGTVILPVLISLLHTIRTWWITIHHCFPSPPFVVSLGERRFPGKVMWLDGHYSNMRLDGSVNSNDMRYTKLKYPRLVENITIPQNSEGLATRGIA